MRRLAIFRFEENHRKDLPEEGECTEDEDNVATETNPT